MITTALTGSRHRRRSAPVRSSLAIQLGAKVGRDSIFYTVVSCFIFPLGLANALLLTHFLSTAQYGQLSVLFTVSGFATVILNLLFLRGTEGMVWGSSDEGIDFSAEELVESHKRPRALGTGVLLSVLLAAVVLVGVLPVAHDLSRWLVNTPRLAGAVIWTAASAGLGAVYRLTWNILRWERRHKQYGVVYILRPLLAVVIAWPLVAAGAGVAGAVAATAIATLITCLYGLTMARNSYEISLDREYALKIVKRSGPMATLMIGIYVLHSGDVFLLSRVASEADVGVFRLAGNLTSVVSYGVSAFLMAWAPLEHSSLFQATYEHHGRQRIRGEFTIYFLVVAGFLTLAMTALATPIVAIFSHRYAGAESFVAMTSAGWVAYGVFIVVARSSSFPRRYLWYGVSAVSSVIGLVVTSLLLGPSLGGYGVALGDITGGLVGLIIIAVVAGTRGQLPSIKPVRVILFLVVTGACYTIGGPLAALAPSLKLELKVVSVALYPLLLLATRVVPGRHLGTLWTIVRRTLHSATRPELLIERVADLPALERRALVTIARDGESPARVTAVTGISEPNVLAKLVAGLRRLAEAGEPGDHDQMIGEYLIARQSITQREGIARELWDLGVAPAVLHKIETAFNTLRQAPAKAWSATVVHGDRDLPPAPWSIDPIALTLIDEVVRRGRTRQHVADCLKLTLRDVDRRLIGALRALSTGGGSEPADSLIAKFLLDDRERLPTGQLWAAGVDPLELHQLELMLAEIRSLPDLRWWALTAAPSLLPAASPDSLAPAPAVAV